MIPNNLTLAVVGLGYVGLPLAVEFSHKYKVVGFDVDGDRIRELLSGKDRTMEVGDEELGRAEFLRLTTDAGDLKAANFYVIAVPTPIDEYKQPDLAPLYSATATVAKVLSRGDIVVYESTVYPGATEEECVPILERLSGLVCNQGFFVGYSPERINPGDKEHRLVTIRKITSGSTPEAADIIDDVYGSIITAGTHKAPSIRVAEAAKVIENTQRDVNIALANELAILFNRLGIDTEEVLAAARTKWNFLDFRPGLVGGHCIGVDPYYLTHKAQAVGHYPEIILAGRRLNDSMGEYVANSLIKAMVKNGNPIRGGRVLVLGLTFKENCPDLRNTRVVDVVRELEDCGLTVDVYDPWPDPVEAKARYGIHLIESPKAEAYDGIVLAVAHHEFGTLSETISGLLAPSGGIVYDVKHVLNPQFVDVRL
jgi:UDP-N-acetyl-D-galactosamine dehydrogenase